MKKSPEQVQTFTLIVISLMCVFFASLLMKVTTADVWWHMATGRYIIENFKIPYSDMFSWTIAGKPWFDFEWLAQIILYGVHLIAGIVGLQIFKAIVTTTIFVTLAATARLFRIPFAISLLILLLVFVVMRPFIFERPQLFSYLFIAFELLALESLLRHQKKYILFLPAVFLFWANLHGGTCAVGIAVLVFYVLGDLITRSVDTPYFDSRWVLDRYRLNLLFMISGLSIAASLANPRGWNIYTHAVSMVLEPSNIFIAEWQKPVFENYLSPYGGLILLLIISFFVAKRLNATCLLFSLVFFALSSTAIRHIPVFAIVAALVIFKNLDIQSVRSIVARLYGNRKFVEAFILCAFLAIPSATFFVMKHVQPERYGVGSITPAKDAADFIEKVNLKGRMFNSYDFGGYLIWRFYLDRKVFIDGRNMDYGSDFTKMAYNWPLKEVWNFMEEKYHPDYAVLKQEPEYSCEELDKNPAWALIYWDDTALVYAKRGRSNDEIIDKYAYKILHPNTRDFRYLRDYVEDPEKKKELLKELERADGELATNLGFLISTNPPSTSPPPSSPTPAK